ncbi:ParB/RepB/Spo0J family partition protein [uncultured Tateyamaria sp.]|uniref:ParB/RepB/Spo0J family partition protein n=1 Tax=uncultured Tateyamaria sp. TaxID=455651 RepID=UPI0026199425|nr:ParB/RepB/Spo0J family partition protein [uncultured Tateyamaria sp.]
MSKRRVFDIDFEPDAGPGPETAPDTPAPAAEQTRRGPMAAAISENATALSERHTAEAEIRAENDRLAHEYMSLKRDGAIVARVPLGDVAMKKLTRDRSTNRDPDLEELKTSIRDLGLSNPIQVEDTGDGYELIQGFRRLSAYKSLYEETGDDKYASIPAVLVAKGEALEKLYRRMVDENMVRRDISFAEMGQLAASYARQMDLELNDAIAVLFASAGRQKRHYIGSFSLLMDKLGPRLQFPEAIPRALGLKLIKALEEQPRAVQQLNVLLEHQKPTDAIAELAVLNKVVAPKPVSEQTAPSTSSKTTIKLNRKAGAVKVIGAKGKIELQMNRDFGSVDPRKLEAAVRALLDQLDL